MRIHPSTYDLAALQARVIERLEAGMMLKTLGTLEGFPSTSTLHRWKRADEGFARRIKAAQAWGRGVQRGNRNAAELYDAVKAEALLAQVRLGVPIGRLWRSHGWPGRRVLRLWKRMRPEFAVELAAAMRAARTFRDLPHPYDEAKADAVVLACAKGGSLREVLRATGMPSWPAVQRWKKAHPEFAAALRTAHAACHRARMAAKRRDTPEVTDAVEAHLVAGGSLNTVPRGVGIPKPSRLYRWKKTRPEFARRIAEAEAWRDEEKADRQLDKDLRIAAEGSPAEIRAALRAMRRRTASLEAGRGRRGEP